MKRLRVNRFFMKTMDANTSMFMATIRIRPPLIASTMGAVAFLLVVISVGGQLIKYVAGHDYVYGLLPLADTLFNVDREQNVTTVFSLFLLLCSAFFLAIIGLIKRQQRDPDQSKWAILTYGFLYLAIDEAWSFHEMLNGPVSGFWEPAVSASSISLGSSLLWLEF